MYAGRFASVCFVLLGSVLIVPALNARQSLNPTQTGYVRLVPDLGTSAPAGVAIFGLRTNSVLITEAGVPFTIPVRSGRIFAETGGPVTTGIALANPNNQDALVSYYLTDNTGQNSGSSSFVIPANQQISAFLTNFPFSLASPMLGTLTFNASIPVAAVGLRSFVNERNEVLMTTVPVSPVGAAVNSVTLLVPGTANAGALNTDVVLLNPGDSPLSGTIVFYGQGSRTGNVQPARVVANGVTSSTFSYSIAPRSFFRLTPQPARNGSPIGSARISPAANSESPFIFEILSYHNNGITVSTSSLSAALPAVAMKTYVESSSVFGQAGSVGSMVTISNPGGTRATVQMNLMNLNGTSTGLSTSADIPAGGQISKLVTDLFPQLPSPFRGVMRMTAVTPVIAASTRQRYNERTDLLMTNTPPYDEASAPLSELEFPEFLSGGGYSTQFIFVATASGQRGSLYLVNQNGAVLSSNSLRSTP